MAIDVKSLKKVESLPASAAVEAHDAQERLLVLVKLREGGRRPDYVTARAEMGPNLFSAEIVAADLKRLEEEPDVESVSISRRLPLMK